MEAGQKRYNGNHVLYYRKMDQWNVSPFLFKAMERNAIRNEWMKYRRNFEYIIAATEEKDRARIKNIFLAKAGPDVQEVFASITGAEIEEAGGEEVDPYLAAIEKLNNYFCPKQHDVFERNRFWTLKPEQAESVEEFAFRCHSLAQKCVFGKTEEEARSISVIDKVILFAPSELKERLLSQKSLDWDQTMQMITSFESVKRQARALSAPERDSVKSWNTATEVNRVGTQKEECSRCGKRDHTGTDPQCPVKNREC